MGRRRGHRLPIVSHCSLLLPFAKNPRGISSVDSRESPTARWTAYAALAGVLGLMAAYAVYWNDALPLTPPELQSSHPPRELGFSVLRAVAPPFIAYAFGVRLMRDNWCGTALAFAFLLFPPVVATYALETPHGDVALYLAMATLFPALAILEPKRRWFYILSAAMFTLAMLMQLDRIADQSEWSVGSGNLLADAVMPYAMIWVGTLMSALALRSTTVRQELGTVGIVCAVGGFAIFALFTFLAPALGIWQPAEMTTALTYVFPLGVLGFMPLIVWVRRVMPTVKSIVAWIAFPVIMYSCFWVVLGPVKTDRYPYSFRASSLEKAP